MIFCDRFLKFYYCLRLSIYLFNVSNKLFSDNLQKMASLDQFVVNIRQLSMDGKFNELAQVLTNPSIDQLGKNIQHIDSILATFTLPEYSMVK
jgi:hypothetical protein